MRPSAFRPYVVRRSRAELRGALACSGMGVLRVWGGALLVQEAPLASLRAMHLSDGEEEERVDEREGPRDRATQDELGLLEKQQ